MELFRETDYRKVVHELIQAMPLRGHGQMSRLARHLEVNTTLVSQVLSGKRDFTEDQALLTAEFFTFNRVEAYYFLLLVQWARARTPQLQALYLEQIQRSQKDANAGLKHRLAMKKDLSFDEQAVYYSNWLYAAVHTLVGIKGYDRVDPIARKLSVKPEVIRTIVSQLTTYNLLVEKGERLSLGVASTYLAPDSPLAVRHHQSWRQIATHRMATHSNQDLYFTGPFSISAADYDELRKEIVEFIGRLYKTVEASPAEDFACINIDLFKF